MAYATISDIFKRYRPINTVVGSSNNQVTSNDVSSAFIFDQEGLIDSYLSSRYITPLSPVPQLITKIASDLTIFEIMVEKLPEVPDFMQARYDRAIKNLELIRDGKMILPSSATLVSTGDNEAWSSSGGKHPIFHPALDDVDQKVDKDWVDEGKEEREDDV